MSEEGSEKEENEEGENEEVENEENEENENEENENEENENENENENEENEEEEKDNKNKKKIKKKKEEKKEKEKVSKDKFKETNEVKIDVNNNNEINFTMGNISLSDRQKTISEILSEVNYEMDFLSKQIDNNFINLNYPKFSYSNYNNYNKENDDYQSLLMRVKELTRIIDNENLKGNNYIKNNIDDDILFNKGMKIQNNFNNYQNKNNNISPYDPNRNKEYYSSLNSNNYNNFHNNNFNNNNNYSNLNNNNYNNNYNNNINLNTNENHSLNSRNLNNNIPLSSNQNNHTVSTNFYNTSRIRKMDELYRTNKNNNENRKPRIYSQMGNPQNINIPLKNIQENITNKNNLISNQNNFERYKPGNITQAMNILLDKE